MILNVLQQVYKDLYKSFCYKVKNENIDVNNQDEKSHILICYQLFQFLNITSIKI